MHLCEKIFLLYADIARRWDQANFFRQLQGVEWYSGMLQSWADSLGIGPGDTVLEVGCGPGLLTVYLAKQGCSVIGIDRSAAMIRAAVKAATPMNVDVRFDSGDAGSLPYATASFSHVISSSLINIVSSPVEILREMSRVTCVGGTVSFLIPADTMTLKEARIFARSRNLLGFSNIAILLWATQAPKMTRKQVEEIVSEVGGLHIRKINYGLNSMVIMAVCSKDSSLEEGGSPRSAPGT